MSYYKTESDYVLQTGSLKRGERLRMLWTRMHGVRLIYILALCALALESLCTFASPVVIKLTIDSVLGEAPASIPPPMDAPARLLLGPSYEGGGMLDLEAVSASGESWDLREWLQGNLWVPAVALLVFTVFQAFFGFVAGILAAHAAETTAKNLRDTLYAHMQDMHYETLLRAQSGDWLQRCTSDVDTTRRFLAFELFEIGRTVFMVAIAFPIMLTLSVELTAWGSIVIPIIMAFSILFYRLVEKAFLAMDESEGRLSSLVQENVTGVRVVRAFARQQLESSKFEASSAEFRELTFKVIMYMAYYWGISATLAIGQLGTVLGAGLTMAAAGTVTLGTLVVFLSYEGQIMFPIRQLGRVLADSSKAMVAMGRIGEILKLRPERHLDDGIVPPIQGDIVFDRINFAFPDGTEVLRDISFSIRQGEVFAILGPTGSGKSALVQLLARLYEPVSGSIRIDGIDIRRIAKRHLRRHITLVLQESFLFGKTIRENIRLARRGAQEGEVFEAARTAALHQVVEGFEKGYETLVGERGVTLSGGQRQRLSLARALIRKSPILILDDSLSAVDTETDAAIRKELQRGEKTTQGSTTIIIAHRLTTLSSADRILVLEQGRVSDIGTHEELIRRPGLYQRLWFLQNSISGEDVQQTGYPIRSGGKEGAA